MIYDVAIACWFAVPFSGSIATEEPDLRTLVGRVVDERRFPVAGASVTVRGLPGNEATECTTGADGRFAIEVPVVDDGDLPADDDVAGLLTFFVTTSDRRVGNATERLPRREWARRENPLRESIVVTPGGRLVADVRDGDGPVPGATLEVRDSSGRPTVTSASTDADGHVLVDPAPVGEFALFVKKAGRGRAAVGARIESGKTFEAHLELRKLRTLAVEFVDAESGEPIPGASVAVTRMADGPDPGAFPSRFRRESFVAEPRTSDAHGHLELRDLEEESILELRPRAPHYVEAGLDSPPPMSPGPGNRKSSRGGLSWRRVSTESGSVQIEMERQRTRTLRWRIVAGPAAAPPDGTPVTIRASIMISMGCIGRPGTAILRGVVRDGVVVAEDEVRPEISGTGTCVEGWAVAPGGTIAELARTTHDGDGTASFASASALAVKLVADDGSPQADQLVSVSLESFDEARETPPNESALTDGAGIARFASLRAGRYVVYSQEISRVVALTGADASIELGLPPLAEVVAEFTLAGERRLPTQGYLSIDGERRDLRREDPERGNVHLFVSRPRSDRKLTLAFASSEWERFTRTLPPPIETGPLVVPVALSPFGRCEAIARVRFEKSASSSVGYGAPVVLERKDEASGAFESFDAGNTLTFNPSGQPREHRLSRLRSGTWRLAMPATGLLGEPVELRAGGEPAVLELDASSLAQPAVVWKIPDGENGDFLELENPDRPAAAAGGRDWNWKESWPLAPPERDYFGFCYDRSRPPSLVIRHPYLVSSRWNDSIDLRNPRSAITLHVEPGPLVAFTPAFQSDAPFVRGAFVSVVERGGTKEPEHRKALRRGDTIVMAPPPAGRFRVLIDPVVAAPAELDDVAFDGGPRDLGPIVFTPGTTLRIHARATPPFAPPRLVARATRLEGVAYERLSSAPESLKRPTDPQIRALGPGRFRVELYPIGSTDEPVWRGEATVDGVHDVDLDVVID